MVQAKLQLMHALVCEGGVRDHSILLEIYYIKLKRCLSARPSVRHVCILPFLYGLTSNLLEVKRLSLGNMEFLFKGSNPSRSPSTAL